MITMNRGLMRITFAAALAFLACVVPGFKSNEAAPSGTAAATKVNGKIAFASRRDHDNYEIYLVNPDGTALQRITNTPGDNPSSEWNPGKDNHTPAWSPDGQKIAFASKRDSLFLELYIMNPDGTNITRLTNNGTIEDFEPAWSPDGQKIAFTGIYTSGILFDDLPGPPPNPLGHNGSDIFVINADGSNLQKLTDGAGAANWGAAWSPDGSRIAFTSARDGNPEIYLMNADGTNQTRITNHTARDLDPAWSPDGQRIAFTSSRREDHCCGIPYNDEIYSMNPDGTGVRRITNAANVNHARPAWSPDGQRIAFQARLINGFVPDTWHIYSINTDGSNQRSVTANYGGDDIDPGWQPLPTGSTVPSGWAPTTIKPEQVELQVFSTGANTFVKVKIYLPVPCFRFDWGGVVRSAENLTADALAERWTEGCITVIASEMHVYDLGQLAPGDYTFTFKTTGVVSKSISFKVASGAQTTSLIDDQEMFVRQQYLDFLGREPDSLGLAHWTNNITKCNNAAQRPAGQTLDECIDKQRVTTSAAFFLSPESRYTGYFIYRIYKGGLGRVPALAEFNQALAALGQGIIVNNQLSGARIEQNKREFAHQFTQRAEFISLYGSLSNQDYVLRLFETTGASPTNAERDALIIGLNNGTETRATVLQKIVDGILVIGEGNQQFNTTYGKAFYEREFNNAFVLMQYFGYLRRDPDAAGYSHWLGKLNHYGNYLDAEMVRSFIISPEYRARFAAP